MARMLGSRPHKLMPWSQCDCGCRAGALGRRVQRRHNRRREAQALRRELSVADGTITGQDNHNHEGDDDD